MSPTPPGKRPGGRTTGANILITAASLALTLGGWAGLTANERETPTPQVAVALLVDPTPTFAIPPLPTVVPPPDWNSGQPLAAQQAIPTPVHNVGAAVTPRRVVISTRVVAPPAAPTAVVAPPRPVTITRSSR